MIIDCLNNKIVSCVENIFSSSEITNNKIQIALTKKEFDGDITLILFPLLSIVKKSPIETGSLIGNELIKYDEIESFNIVSGFLNLVLSDDFINSLFSNIYFDNNFGSPIIKKSHSETTLVEFSSPNTNKPLHLGHIRNILLGNSISNILKKNGHNVKSTSD